MKTIFDLKETLLQTDWYIVSPTNLIETHIQCILNGEYIVAEYVCVSGGMFGCGIYAKIPASGFKHLFDQSKWFNIELF